MLQKEGLQLLKPIVNSSAAFQEGYEKNYYSVIDKISGNCV